MRKSEGRGGASTPKHACAAPDPSLD